MLLIVRVTCRDSIVVVWYQDGQLLEYMTALFSYN